MKKNTKIKSLNVVTEMSAETETGPVVKDNNGQIILKIHATPGAKKNTILEIGDEEIRTHISCPPVDGKANAELLSFFQNILDLKKNEISIGKGLKSRNKMLIINSPKYNVKSRMSNSYTTPWGAATNLVEKLKIGDLVEFQRTAKCGIKIYSHWGIYIGSRNGIHGIAHLTNGENNDKVLERTTFLTISGVNVEHQTALVRVDDIFDVAFNDRCRINNSLDRYYKPLPGKVIYLRVKYRMGDCGYNLFNNNCEHFVNWARYNLSTSTQAKIGKAIVYGVAVFTVSSCPVTALCAGGLSYLGLEGYDVVRKVFPVDACFKYFLDSR
ncbi:Protein of unknown function DUF167 family and LRAT-like domain-containing protein [Strongyloides ratti]|uniref:LRAT domain-containing protein n=1 Tax=Strongyloides ratti TaxID=34506 RepID=A0A090L9H8_STRRB|nr:Protein of unknown function DUF167 family and LRAT-like domain-containing protein [Strongyloides ratti]CEF64155.1 Protein of unknown function DUF167 family and LRAT-like domain-containing protein [Strongyloides ratti]